MVVTPRNSLIALADAIIALDKRANDAERDLSVMRGRYETAQNDVGIMMRERNEAREERDAARASSLTGFECLASAIETLKWIAHGHTDEVQNVRDVARRRLEALGVSL